MVIGTRKELARKKALADRKAPITSLEFGRYLIKAGWLNGRFLARAFPGPGARTKGLIAEATGESEEEAIRLLKEQINKRNRSRKAARRQDFVANSGIPGPSEFVEALGHIKITEAQAIMLRTLAAQGETGMSLEALSIAGGYKTAEAATRNLRVLAVLIADYLSSEAETGTDEDGSTSENLLVSRVANKDEVPENIFAMHPELREALSSMV